jgi:hypothetical protein
MTAYLAPSGILFLLSSKSFAAFLIFIASRVFRTNSSPDLTSDSDSNLEEVLLKEPEDLHSPFSTEHLLLAYAQPQSFHSLVDDTQRQ